jgi:hypothetical protein
MPSPAAAVPNSKLRLVIIVRDSEVLAIIRAFGENLLPICSL